MLSFYVLPHVLFTHVEALLMICIQERCIMWCTPGCQWQRWGSRP